MISSDDEAGEANEPSTKSPAKKFARISVYRTQHGSDRLKRVATLKLGKDKSGFAQFPTVYVCPECEVSKPWLGFGGSFSESSAIVFRTLTKQKQEEVLHAYFDRKTGLGYTLGRVPIGSCDFSVGTWTCGDITPDDETLTGFSIDHYRAAIIPMILRAADVAGSPLALLASPWSPVPWMRTVKKFNAGVLRKECRNAWAHHYVRFIQEMQRYSIPIWGVSVQNEPESLQPWESCVWSAEDEMVFVRDHLGPALDAAGMHAVKILVWDHNRDGMLERAAVVYSDPEAAKYVWGVAYHWYGDARFEVWPDMATVPFTIPQRGRTSVQDVRGQACFENVRRVAELRPDKHILFTEGCQELAGVDLGSELGNWKFGERYAMNLIADINAGCEGWIDWNLCLDERGGPNHVGNYCVAPIILDSRSGRVLYQPAFWYLAHFARFIHPGARRVVCSTSRDMLEVTAFMNHSAGEDTLVVVVMNQSDKDVSFWLKVAGSGATKVSAPLHSIITIVIDGGDAEKRPKEREDLEVPWLKAAREDELAHVRSAEQDSVVRRASHQAENAKKRATAKELASQHAADEKQKRLDTGRIWLVVGGGNTGGILVRKGESMQSPLLPERLATGARIEQLFIRNNRLQYQKISGDGPDLGFVSVKNNQNNLVEPDDSDVDDVEGF
mmetsp:Transcript_125185/g.365599  ORF Transcript_125185/g.365599 Transcript_125185/m.365599 type:complete len:669 (-) Transcript_125185:190-2196(-)